VQALSEDRGSCPPLYDSARRNPIGQTSRAATCWRQAGQGTAPPSARIADRSSLTLVRSRNRRGARRRRDSGITNRATAKGHDLMNGAETAPASAGPDRSWDRDGTAAPFHCRPLSRAARSARPACQSARAVHKGPWQLCLSSKLFEPGPQAGGQMAARCTPRLLNWWMTAPRFFSTARPTSRRITITMTFAACDTVRRADRTFLPNSHRKTRRDPPRRARTIRIGARGVLYRPTRRQIVKGG